MRRRVFIACIATALLLTAGASYGGKTASAGASQAQASTTEVKIDDFSFGPQMIAVPGAPAARALPRYRVPLEALTVALVALTGHLGGSLGGVNV